MATNLNIDPKLLSRAQKIGGHRTKRETVNTALDQYIRHREQLKVFELAGTIDFDPDFDYKKQRRRG
jgi:hypothetical protein